MTTPPTAAPEPEIRRDTSTFRRIDGVTVIGAAVAAISTTAVLFTRIAPFSGLLGFVVTAFVVFLGLYALLVSLNDRGPTVRDRIAAACVQSIALLLLAALGFVVVYTLWKGHQALLHANFFTQDLTHAGPLDPLTVGGALHAVLGTLEQISIALGVTVPLGLTCALFLSETRGAFTRFVRTVVEAMTALPSIVAGLFIYATALLLLGLNKSGFAASLAISVMMLPIVIRAADVVLRLVPGSLKEASLALGASRWRAVWHVVLPTARSGLATALILGTARGVGETSPVLLTAGYTTALNLNPFAGPQASLPLATFTLVRSPQQGMVTRGFGTAAVLLALVLVLFAIARLVGGRGAGDLSPRQQRRRVRASNRDFERYRQRHDVVIPGGSTASVVSTESRDSDDAPTA